MKIKHIIIASLSCVTIMTGCSSSEQVVIKPAPGCSYINKDIDLASIGRVTFIELEQYAADETIAQDATDSLFLSMQKKQLFGLDLIRQNDTKWKNLKLEPDQSYTIEQLSLLLKTVRSKAIIVGTVTQFKPYPHMTMGLRLKMIDLRDGQLIWAFEQIWDCNDQNTKQRIKQYFKSKNQSGSDQLNEQLIAKSSKKFVDFISYEVAQTLLPLANHPNN